MSEYRKKRRQCVKKMFKFLEEIFGKHDAGLFLAIVCDLLNEFTKDVERRELRTLELKLNDYFTVKYDFEKNEIV